MKFEGNSIFSYDEVVEILNDNYFNKESVEIALMEKAMEYKSYDNEDDTYVAGTYVSDIIDRIESGRFPICYECENISYILSGVSKEEIGKIMMEGNYGMSASPEPYFAQVVANAQFDNRRDGKGIEVTSAILCDYHTEYQVPVNNIKIPFSELRCNTKEEISIIAAGDNYDKINENVSKVEEISNDELERQKYEFNNLRNQIKEIKDYFDENKINVTFNETYEGVEMKCYERKNLPDVDVYYNFNSSFVDTLYILSDCLMNIETKENKAELLVDLAEEIMSGNDYENNITEVSYIDKEGKRLDSFEYIELFAKEVEHLEKRIEAGEHDLNI